jgi:hypothetical protein
MKRLIVNEVNSFRAEVRSNDSQVRQYGNVRHSTREMPISHESANHGAVVACLAVDLFSPTQGLE